MSGKRDGASYWQPKPKPVRAVRWEPGIDHPNVKKHCTCGKGADRCGMCATGKPVLANGGNCVPILRGDYIIGPDDNDLVHVFSGKEFEELFEPVRANDNVMVKMPESKWMWSTFAINSVEALLMWLTTNKDSRWAQSNPGAAQEMYEHSKFLRQHVDAMRRAQKGE